MPSRCDPVLLLLFCVYRYRFTYYLFFFVVFLFHLPMFYVCARVFCFPCLTNAPSLLLCALSTCSCGIIFRQSFIVELYCSCVAVAIISLASPVLWEFFACRLTPCLFFGEQTFSQIRSIYVGIHGPLFVATAVDRCDCVHIALSALQR